MVHRSLPFENRWASGNQASHWMLRLEREGVTSVLAMYAEHELHESDSRTLFEDVPVAFARDWLNWRERSAQREKRNHRLVVDLLLFLILVAIVLVGVL